MLTRLPGLAFVATLLFACGARSGFDDAGSGAAGSSGQPNGSGPGSPSGVGPGQSSGSSSGSVCVDEIIAKDGAGAHAVYVEGDTVFWGTLDGAVRLRENGTTKTLAMLVGAVVSVAPDPTYVYAATDSAVYALPRKGGAPVVIASDITPSQIVLDGGSLFVMHTGGPTQAGGILRIDGSSTQVLSAELTAPSGFAIDESWIYFAAASITVQQTEVPFVVGRLPKTGGDIQVLSNDVIRPGRVAVDADRVYVIEQEWNQTTPGVRAIPKTGGPASIVATLPSVIPLLVAVDGTSIYVASAVGTGKSSTTSLQRFDGDPSSGAVLASATGSFYSAMATSNDAVFLTSAWLPGDGPVDHGSVRKVCKH